MRIFTDYLNHNVDLSGNRVLRFKCPVPHYAEEAIFSVRYLCQIVYALFKVCRFHNAEILSFFAKVKA